MARGNGRQQIVRDDHDRERLLEDLRRAVLRCGWELLAFVFMGNHLHLFFKTPRPNLARGMQQFLSSYAIWHGRRRRRAPFPGTVPGRTHRGRELLLDRQPLHPPQSRAGQTPAGRSPARLALVELSGLRPPAAARWMGGLRGFAFGLAWRVGRQRSPGGLPAVRRAGTGEGSGKPLSVRGAWLAAGQRDVHRADAIAAERAEKPRRGAHSPAIGQPGRGDRPGRSGPVLRC